MPWGTINDYFHLNIQMMPWGIIDEYFHLVNYDGALGEGLVGFRLENYSDAVGDFGGWFSPLQLSSHVGSCRVLSRLSCHVVSLDIQTCGHTAILTYGQTDGSTASCHARPLVLWSHGSWGRGHWRPDTQVIIWGLHLIEQVPQLMIRYYTLHQGVGDCSSEWFYICLTPMRMGVILTHWTTGIPSPMCAREDGSRLMTCNISHKFCMQ